MTAAEDLFEALKLAYDKDGLVTLTNIRDRTKTVIDEIYGDATAQSVIDLWPAYVQIDYDETNALHVEVAMEMLVALFQKRGGYATTISEITWDQAIAMLDRVKKTGPRGREGPQSNAPDLSASGSELAPWSDESSFAEGIYPTRRTTRGT